MSMKTLCEQSDNYGKVSDTEARNVITGCTDDGDVTVEIGTAMKKLWADPGIQATYVLSDCYLLSSFRKLLFSV